MHHYLLFILAGILLNLTPGQDTLYVLGRSLSGGLRAGIAAALGIGVGSLIHTVAAALGLSVLLAASPTAFMIVKLCGAAYLVFLGAKLLFFRPRALAAPRPSERGDWSAFAQGILSNVLNPKVALFFLAFLPQFISPASTSKTLDFLALGATFVTTGTIWCLILAFAAARLSRFFAANPAVRTLIDRAAGALFIALGARLAFAR
jgi:threonine/homoserine/homoserine lactone efflux protein